MNDPATVSKMDTTAEDFGASLREDLNKFHPQGNDAGKEGRRQLNRWRRAICSRRGPDPIARLTALVLANYLLSEHDAAPSQDRLAVQIGLKDTKAVGKALRRLVLGRWLVQVSDKRPGRGARGVGYRYLISFPQQTKAVRKSPVLEPGLLQSYRTTKPSSPSAKPPISVRKMPRNSITPDVVLVGRTPC